MAFAVVLGILCAATVARAATVVLVRPPEPTPTASEATVRLRGELAAAGFDVEVIDASAGADVRASLEAAAASPNVEAVVAIFGEDAPDSAEVWVMDRATRKTVVRRLPRGEPESTRAAEVLSIRALELLRASFLEANLSASWSVPNLPPAPPRPRATAKTKGAEPPPETDSAPGHTGFAAELGACMRGGLQGIPPSLLPIARVEWGFARRFLGRLTLAGLGTRARVDLPTTSGSAEVAQTFALAEGAIRFRLDRWFQPFLSLGAGALRVSASGQAEFPYQGRSAALWAAVADAGAGVRVIVGKRFEVSIEGHAQLVGPEPVIRFIGTDVAREGRPTLIGSLTVVAWL